MDEDEKMRLAAIAGATHALKIRKKENHYTSEDLIKSVSENMSKILKKLGESETSPSSSLITVAAISGASHALKFADHNLKSSDKEILKNVSDEMDSIISNIDK